MDSEKLTVKPDVRILRAIEQNGDTENVEDFEVHTSTKDIYNPWLTLVGRFLHII